MVHAAQASIHAALRECTQRRHDTIEALLRLDDTLDIGRYGRVLQGFEAFLTAWEPQVAALLPLPVAGRFLARSRLGFVRADLRALGLPRWPLPHVDLPRLPLSSPAAAFGSWYVLAGSALGGQLVARRAAAQLGLTPARGTAYFHGWGTSTVAHWRDYLNVLADEVPATGPDAAQACEAARATFDRLIGTFACLLDERVAA